MTRKFEISMPSLNLHLPLEMLTGAIAIYVALSIYLFKPHLIAFDPWRGLFVPATNFAALGAFLLALRWVANPGAAFFSGLLYGFGPFTLGFAMFHPASAAAVAIIPWLFMPAAFWPKTSKYGTVIRATLALLPFVAIALFFAVAARYSFYPVPIGEKFHVTPLHTLVGPLISNAQDFPIFNFYHVAAGPLVMGLLLFFRLHRVGTIILLIAGVALGLSSAVGPASPIIWGSIAVLCVCIMIGLGLNGLTVASSADSIWVSLCGFVLAALALICGIEANGRTWWAWTALWYLLGTAAVFGVLAAAIYDKAWHKWRFFALAVLILADVFINSRITVDKLF